MVRHDTVDRYACTLRKKVRMESRVMNKCMADNTGVLRPDSPNGHVVGATLNVINISVRSVLRGCESEITINL